MNNICEFIEFVKYDSNINSINIKFNNYKEKLEDICNIEIYDKLGYYYDNKFYINKNQRFQPIMRWLYGNNRNNSINTLYLIFKDYNLLLTNIELCFRKYKHDNEMYSKLIEISNEVIDFNTKLKYGIHNLKLTYKDDRKVQSDLGEILFIITRFNENINLNYN